MAAHTHTHHLGVGGGDEAPEAHVGELRVSDRLVHGGNSFWLREA